jgi:hypothetical protein
MDKSRKIDIEVKKIHTEIKKSSLVLRERMHDIQTELTEWNLLDGQNGDSGENFLHQK